jgi:hypothetical protein
MLCIPGRVGHNVKWFGPETYHPPNMRGGASRRELAVTQVFRHHYPDDMAAGTMTVAMHGIFTIKKF